MNNPTEKTFTHKNPNALKALVSIVSLQYTGPIDFVLEVVHLLYIRLRI